MLLQHSHSMGRPRDEHLLAVHNAGASRLLPPSHLMTKRKKEEKKVTMMVKQQFEPQVLN